MNAIQGPKKWFATKEGPRQEQAIFSGSVESTTSLTMFANPLPLMWTSLMHVPFRCFYSVVNQIQNLPRCPSAGTEYIRVCYVKAV